MKKKEQINEIDNSLQHWKYYDIIDRIVSVKHNENSIPDRIGDFLSDDDEVN